MLHSRGTLRLINSYFRPLPIHFNKFSNNLRHFSALGPNIPIKSSVNCEGTRRKLSFCTSPIVNQLQLYRLQSFSSSSSGPGKFDAARSLMVAGLSSDTTVAALRGCFSKKWDVTNCTIAQHKTTGTSRQYGFVEFLTTEQAKHALEFDHFIDGKQVNVKMKGGKELEDKYRIFVGGLLKDTSGESLESYFSNYGDIFECHIVRNEDNSSKGFGYVTYKSQDSVDRALNSRPHSIDNHVLSVKHADSRRRELALFIGNLSPKTNDESLRKHFSKYGQLTQSEVKIDRQTGQSRGFGYVGFKSQEELDRALNEQHVIDGVEVAIRHKTHELDLVVDSLPRNISEKSLWNFFSRYGQVQDYRFIKNSAGNTTAFVSMSSRDEISRALNARPHKIDGKLIYTHQKDERFKLFVGDLPTDATDEDLYETFSKVGKPVHWQVMRDWNRNRPFGYAYVAFSSAEEVDRVMDGRPYNINGQEVTVQRRLGRKKE